MDKQKSLGATGGLNGESSGEVTGGMLGDIRGVKAGAGLPSEVVLSHDSGRPLYPGGILTGSPGSSQPSEVVAVHGSMPNQHSGKVVGHSLPSGTYPDGLKTPFSGTCESRTSDFGSERPGVHNSGGSPRSGSACLQPHKRSEDRPRGILKNISSTLMHESHREEKRKFQHWDEMNIMATYHPADKDYGFMKVDEPSTPYHRLQNSDENLLAGPSHIVTPEALAERLATMDNFWPKVLQGNDNRSSGSSDNFSKTYSSDFEKHRKAHYDEGKLLKTQKNLPWGNNMNSSEDSESLVSGSRNVTLGPGSRSVEKDWAGGLAREVKDEIGMVTRNHILETKDSSAFRNQSPASSISMLDKEVHLQRKEYYSKGRYLRCCPYPELEEDMEDEQQNSSQSSSENSIRTEVRLLDHTGSPLQDHRPSRTP